jgi:hypothetical protein
MISAAGRMKKSEDDPFRVQQKLRNFKIHWQSEGTIAAGWKQSMPLGSGILCGATFLVGDGSWTFRGLHGSALCMGRLTG